MMMNATTMMTMKMLTTHQHHHPSDKIMITRTKATTSKRDETRTRRQKPNDCAQKNHPFFLFLSLWRAIVRVFSSVLSSLLSDRIRFRIGKIASLSTLINLHLFLLSRCAKESVKERKTSTNDEKFLSKNSTNSREV